MLLRCVPFQHKPQLVKTQNQLLPFPPHATLPSRSENPIFLLGNCDNAVFHGNANAGNDCKNVVACSVRARFLDTPTEFKYENGTIGKPSLCSIQCYHFICHILASPDVDSRVAEVATTLSCNRPNPTDSRRRILAALLAVEQCNLER